MKYKIRKRENVTQYLASDIAELDDESFRKLKVNPYTGANDKDFLQYIADMETFDGLPEDLDEQNADQLNKIKGDALEMKEYGSSAEKFEGSWFELGEINEELRKTGGFEIKQSTLE